MNRRRWLLVLAAPTLMTAALLAQAPRQPAQPAPKSAQPAQPASKAAQPAQPRLPAPAAQGQQPAVQSQRNPDAVAEAQTPRQVEAKRPEQRTTDHDRPERFSAKTAIPISPALKGQPKAGRVTVSTLTPIHSAPIIRA